MPGFDQTGPMGQGPMTGRGLGPCGGGMAYGRGYGRGRGWRHWGYYPPVREEKEVLVEELKSLKEEMKMLENRLGELKKKK